MNCTSPCTISGLDPGTEYQFTVIPNNNCGSPTGCTGNTDTVITRGKQLYGFRDDVVVSVLIYCLHVMTRNTIIIQSTLQSQSAIVVLIFIIIQVNVKPNFIRRQYQTTLHIILNAKTTLVY